MKKILIIVMSLVMLTSAVGCSNQSNEDLMAVGTLNTEINIDVVKESVNQEEIDKTVEFSNYFTEKSDYSMETFENLTIRGALRIGDYTLTEIMNTVGIMTGDAENFYKTEIVVDDYWGDRLQYYTTENVDFTVIHVSEDVYTVSDIYIKNANAETNFDTYFGQELENLVSIMLSNSQISEYVSRHTLDGHKNGGWMLNGEDLFIIEADGERQFTDDKETYSKKITGILITKAWTFD